MSEEETIRRILEEAAGANDNVAPPNSSFVFLGPVNLDLSKKKRVIDFGRVSPMRALLIAALLAIFVILVFARDLTGTVRVIDGDSLAIGSEKIRLFGIDAPEWAQECERDGKPWRAGQEATAFVRSKIEGKEIACAPYDQDRYGRTVAVCYFDGEDLNDTIVRSGWAVAYTRYSNRYVEAEVEARAAGRGIWRATCETPETWRRAHPREGR